MKADTSINASKWSFGACVAFIALLALLHIVKSEIDPSWNFISEYQIGRLGWLMHIAFFSLSLSCIFLSISLWKPLNFVGKIGIIMLLISAAGMLIAAIFKTDPLNTPPEFVTQSGKLHQFGAMLDLIPFAALFITLSILKKMEWHINRLLLLSSLVLIWFGFIYFVVSMATQFPVDGKFGPNILLGWQNRIMIITQVLWLAIISRQVANK
jgi:hypothetical protein